MAKKIKNETGQYIPASTAFFRKTYDETVGLLIEAQDYVARAAAPDRGRLHWLDVLRMHRDIGRVTARLAEIMAWLLVQRAVEAGELTSKEAVQADRRLNNKKVCLEEATGYHGSIPPRLDSLLDRSHKLYIRVMRLDEMISRAVD